MNLVITGMGAVTPIGIGVTNYWHNLIGGVCGIRKISQFDASHLPVQIAAEIQDFDSHILPRNLQKSDRFTQFAFLAAQEALNNLILDRENHDRIGVVVGTALAGITTLAQTQDDLSLGKIHKVSPHLVPSILGNAAAAQIAIAHRLHGPSLTINTACSSGGDALILSAMMIKAGELDACLAVGADSILSPVIISSLAQAKALSRNNDCPEQASRPFDLERDGFVIGEGGGALLVESEEHARARKAKIYAKLSGYANTADGYHITAPDPSGRGAILCMKKALQCAHLTPEDIDYINAHGTSTPLGDKVETRAVKQIFNDIRKIPPISSTKGATGHLMGAGGLTELIACILSISESILPPTLHYHTPDPDCDLDYIPNTARPAPHIHAAMSNSLGFGGQNCSIVVEQMPEAFSQLIK